MTTIGGLLTRDLNQRIEEIIQVHQADEQSVHAEIREYVATTSIHDQYAELLKAMAEAPAEPHEAIGVWISGFFGSGKSPGDSTMLHSVGPVEYLSGGTQLGVHSEDRTAGPTPWTSCLASVA